jgi:hypothetical protein
MIWITNFDEEEIKGDLRYLFYKVRKNTIRFKKGKIKFYPVSLKQYCKLLIKYIKYIHIRDFYE